MDKHKYNTINNWKRYGVISDNFDKLYEEHMKINNCQLCNIHFNKDIRSHWRCLDHDHRTGLYRQTICFSCNCKYDLMKNKNNKTGYKNISYYQKRKNYVYEKMIDGNRIRKYFKTLQEAIDYKENIEK
jgi:hypothetical protein